MTFVLLYIFLIICSFALQSHGRFNPPDFSGFKRCLLDNGGTSENLVWRSNSSRYVNLNHQAQLLGSYRYPKAYALVHNDRDVTRVIRCGRRHSIHLVAKGGGHSFEKYSFGDKSSVIVDVQHLTKLSVDKVKLKARVGSGHLIGPLKWQLWTTAKAFIPMGDCPSVGIVGLTLGGGWGNFAQTHGMTLDNLLGITVVLANGTVCKTSSKNYPDLFWALRGAGATSFGIVTSFTFQLYPAPSTVTVTTVSYKLSQFPSVYAAWQAYNIEPSNGVTAQISTTLTQLSIFFYHPSGFASNIETPHKRFPRGTKVTQENYSYPDFLVYETKRTPFENSAAGYELNTPSDLANIGRSSAKSGYTKYKSFYVSRQIDTKSIKKWTSFLMTMPPSIYVSFEGYRGKINAVSTNDTAFVHRGGTLYNALATYSQVNSSRKELAFGKKWRNEFFNFGYKIFRHNETYQNNIDGDLQDFKERYYGCNLPKLIEIKRKYDPDNFFNNPQSIPLK